MQSGGGLSLLPPASSPHPPSPQQGSSPDWGGQPSTQSQTDRLAGTDKGMCRWLQEIREESCDHPWAVPHPAWERGRGTSSLKHSSGLRGQGLGPSAPGQTSPSIPRRPHSPEPSAWLSSSSGKVPDWHTMNRIPRCPPALSSPRQLLVAPRTPRADFL